MSTDGILAAMIGQSLAILTLFALGFRFTVEWKPWWRR